jgi:ferritin-like metal-binding protein YciE
MINVMILPIFKVKKTETEITEIDVCKSIFGFDKTKVGVEQGQKMFVECNFSVLKKLAQKMLFNVKVQRTIEDQNQVEDLEETTEEITKSEYSEDKAEQMVSSIKSQLTYLDNNNSLDGILQIENHIRELKNYGEKLENIVEPLRKQSKINKDLYGSWVVDNATSVVLEGNTIKAIEDNFRKKFKVA